MTRTKSAKASRRQRRRTRAFKAVKRIVLIYDTADISTILLKMPDSLFRVLTDQEIAEYALKIVHRTPRKRVIDEVDASTRETVGQVINVARARGLQVKVSKSKYDEGISSAYITLPDKSVWRVSNHEIPATFGREVHALRTTGQPYFGYQGPETIITEPGRGCMVERLVDSAIEQANVRLNSNHNHSD